MIFFASYRILSEQCNKTNFAPAEPERCRHAVKRSRGYDGGCTCHSSRLPFLVLGQVASRQSWQDGNVGRSSQVQDLMARAEQSCKHSKLDHVKSARCSSQEAFRSSIAPAARVCFGGSYTSSPRVTARSDPECRSRRTLRLFVSHHHDIGTVRSGDSALPAAGTHCFSSNRSGSQVSGAASSLAQPRQTAWAARINSLGLFFQKPPTSREKEATTG